MAATVIDEAWYKANNPPPKGNWTMEILKQGWKIDERKWKEYRSKMDSWMIEDGLKGANLSTTVNKVKKGKLVGEFLNQYENELEHVEKEWLWESVSHLINHINSAEIKKQKKASQKTVRDTPTPSPSKLSRRGSNSSMETLGISQMDVCDRVPLGRCNIEINHPTLGILELAVLTCLAPLLPGASRVNPDEIGCNDISQDVIEGMIKAEGQWDEAYKWAWESQGVTQIVIFRFSFPAMINSLDLDRRDNKLRLKLINPNTQNLPGFQPPSHGMSPSFNPSSGSGGSPSPATRGKPKSRGRRQTKIPLLPGTDTSTPSPTASPAPLPSSEKKGTEQPGKKRKTESKKVKFSDPDETYRPLKLFLKDGLARAGESDNSESSEEDVLSFQETRLRRQRRERRPADPSDEGVGMNERETSRSPSPDKPAAPTEEPALPDFVSTLKLNVGYKENGEDDDEVEEIEEDEDIIRKMIQLRELSANTQLSGPTWLRCCQFFKINPNDGKFKQYTIPGMSKSLYSYQIHAIEWILRTVRGIAGGCWVADEMGLGKTAQTIGLIVMNYLLCRIWDDIGKSRKAGDGRHLPKGHAPEDICPSDKEMFFACPCKENGHGAWATPIRLPTLILSPLKAMDTWTMHFFGFVNIQNETMKGLRFHIAHSQASIFASNAQKKLDKIAIPDLSIDRSVYAALMPTPDGMPCDSQLGLIILTTPQSYASKVNAFTQAVIADAWVRDEKATRTNRVTKEKESYIKKVSMPAKTGPGMRWGHIVVDESQHEKRDTSFLATILTQYIFKALDHYKKKKRAKLIYVSGTPCQRGPADMEVQLQHLETPEWAQDTIFKSFTRPEIKKMISTYNQMEKGLTNIPQAVKDRFYFDFPKLLQNVMICRTSDTIWFDKPLLTLPPKEDAYKWDCPVKPEWKESMKKFAAQEFKDLEKEYRSKKKVTQQKFLAKSSKLRICYSFPALLPMFLNGEVDLTWEEVTHKDNAWHKNPEESPYWKKLDEIIASAQKVDRLRYLMNDVMRTDVDGNPEKLLIMTYKPIEAFIIVLYLRKLGRKADMYSSSSSVKERARMIAGFQDEKDSEGNFVIRDQEQRPDFLVGTLEMLNDCLQLTRAFRLVLFSPDIDFGKMTQAEKREHRIGQKNPKTYTYIFYNSDSTIDVAILETSGIIAMIIGRVLSTSADELDGKVVVIRD